MSARVWSMLDTSKLELPSLAISALFSPSTRQQILRSRTGDVLPAAAFRQNESEAAALMGPRLRTLKSHQAQSEIIHRRHLYRI